MSSEDHAPDNQSHTEVLPSEVAQLKRLARGIVQSQGNRFIKELLREKEISIGSTKADFARHLETAIDTGQLSLADVEGWLHSVEGWGNQHVYLYSISDRLARRFLTESAMRRRVEEAGLSQLWEADTVMVFPEEPQLTSISFRDNVFRLVWQESSPGWIAVPDRNYQVEEGLDTFEFRAYRMQEERAITRFEARLDLRLAALFIPKPIQGDEHKLALAKARNVLDLLLDLDELDDGRLDISMLSRNMDQRNVRTNAHPNPEIKTQKSRLAAGGSWVEFAAASKDKAYWEEQPVQDVRLSVRDEQIGQFQGRGGIFVFQASSGGLERALRVQLYGQGNRIRLWAQMDVSEVWKILEKVSQYQ